MKILVKLFETISGQIILSFLKSISAMNPYKFHRKAMETFKEQDINIKRFFSDDIIKTNLDSFVIKAMLKIKIIVLISGLCSSNSR